MLTPAIKEAAETLAQLCAQSGQREDALLAEALYTALGVASLRDPHLTNRLSEALHGIAMETVAECRQQRTSLLLINILTPEDPDR